MCDPLAVTGRVASAHSGGRPILAEGWGLWPELVAPIVDSPRRLVVMVPTSEFRRHQLRALPRATAFGHQVSDPARGQRNRLDRDRLVAQDAVHAANRLGIRVIEVDGTRDAEAVAEAVADVVADHFSPHLPPPETLPGESRVRRQLVDLDSHDVD